jgi:hypothetical protein
MAYPPASLPSTVDVTDLTVMATRHPGDHNWIAEWLAVLAPSAWTYVNIAGGAAPAFQNAWGNYQQGWQLLRFRRECGDVCRIEGLIGGGASGAVIFTLPLGFRPAMSVRFAGVGTMSAGGSFAANLDINPSGTVQLSTFGGTNPVAAGNVNCAFVIDPTSL